MAEPAVTLPGPSHITVGKLLFEALRKLEFDPEILCWVNFPDDELQLAMVTSLADRVGTFGMYETLYRAQDWKMIPSEFDLLSLSIYSPHSELGLDIQGMLTRLVDGNGNVANQANIADTLFTVGVADPWFIPGNGIYAIKKVGYSAIQDAKRWRKFERAIKLKAA